MFIKVDIQGSMPRAKLHFEFDSTATQTSINTNLASSLLPFSILPTNLTFSPVGGFPVMVRSGVVKIAFMKIAATGVLAGLVAITSDNVKVAFSCCLAAAVNFVACMHYYVIWRIRAQHLPYAYMRWALDHDKNNTFNNTGIDENKGKMFAQEMAVDGLRHTDWAVRLLTYYYSNLKNMMCSCVVAGDSRLVVLTPTNVCR